MPGSRPSETRTTLTGSMPVAAGSAAAPLPVPIPDHLLLRPIGKGSYGEVWLARTVLGIHRAVKIVRRQAFTDDRPFDREFAGIQRFEPISRSHESQLNILHIGRGPDYFYYVMELADDAGQAPPSPAPGEASSASPTLAGKPDHEPAFNPETYTARTLRSDLLFRGRLPVDECIRLGLALTTALEHLHRHGLVHRDIKPSNIVFVNGIPKLADIGLVALAESTMSFVGTEGYIPPEGPGTPQADIFSLGKVLYEISTGRDRQEFPELPSNIVELPERAELTELNEVLIRACHPDPAERYASAAEMHADLALLQSGKSVSRMRILERRLRFLARTGAVVTAVALAAAAAWLWQQRQTREARRLADENRVLAEEKGRLALTAQQSEQITRENLYAADINLAHQALLANNLRQARSLLQRHVPQSGQPDLRGFEWRYLWNQCRGAELSSLQPRTGHPVALSFSPDNRLLAIGHRNGTTTLLDVASRRELAALPGTNQLFNLAFLPGTNRLLTASSREIRIWNLQAQTVERTLPGALAPAVLSPDGRFLLTRRDRGAEADQEVHSPFGQPHEVALWDTATWEPVRSALAQASASFYSNRMGYVGFTFNTLFTPDSRRVVVLAGDTLRLLTVPELEPAGRISARLPWAMSPFAPLAISRDGRTLALRAPDGFGVQLWDLQQDRHLRSLGGHSDTLSAIAFSPDGRVVATSSTDQTIRLWQVSSGELLQTLQGQADEVFDLAFSPDGKMLASIGGIAGEVKLWDPAARPRNPAFRKPEGLAGFDADGTLVALSKAPRSFRELDPDLGTARRTDGPRMRPEAAYGVFLNSLSPDGEWQALWGGEKQGGSPDFVEVWDRRQGRLLCSLPSVGPLFSFAPTRRLLAAYAQDRTCSLWELPAGTRKWTFTNEATPCLSPDGRYFFSSDTTGSQVWDLRVSPPESVAALPQAFNAAFSPDGHLLATDSEPGEIHLWMVPSGKEAGRFQGHTRGGIRLAFSPDGRTLASMADDRTLRFWHVATQRELLRFESPTEDNGGFLLEFSPDGRSLVASRNDEQGPIHWLYRAPSFAEIAVAEGRDYRKEAGDNPFTWLQVAKRLHLQNRPDESLLAYDEVLQRTAQDDGLAWLRRKAVTQRIAVLTRLGRLAEAASNNCVCLGVPMRPLHAPTRTVDLSPFYTGELATNGWEQLPQGIQTLDGSVFDLRGLVRIAAASPHEPWPIDPARIEGIPIRHKATRLHFLQAAEYEEKDLPAGTRIGCFRVRWVTGETCDVPLLHHRNTGDWREFEEVQPEPTAATVAWRHARDAQAAGFKASRLFHLTWSNPQPDVELAAVDFIAERPNTRALLIGLTVD